MKQRIILAALLGIALASCQNDNVGPETNSVSHPANFTEINKDKPANPAKPKPDRPVKPEIVQ